MGTIELTKSQVWKNFRDDYYFYLDEEAPYHVGKTKALFKRLIDEQGLETTNELLGFVCKKWKALKRKYKLSGFPSMGIIYGYRQSFLGDLRENQRGKKGQGDASADKQKLYFNS